MRILFASTGGAGHFTPMTPFADAARRAGHEVAVVGPPALADAAERAGYPFTAGAAPDEAELGPIWSQVPGLSYDEAERLVIGQIFATLNVRAMLPAVREAVRTFRPDVVVREPAEFASAVVAEERGVAHVQVGIGLVASQIQITTVARTAVDAWRPGLTERIAATPYLTLFPTSVDTGHGTDPSPTHRFRAPSAPVGPLAPHWPGDDRPLVYVTFGSVAASVPTAAGIYDVAVAAVADLPARVLLTTGEAFGDGHLQAPGPHVHVARWVPQADVLPHASVVVCHGGSGTTLGALAAGVPLVIAPLFADQPVNARAVAEVGAGLAVRPRDDTALSSAVDPDELRAAVETVLRDGAFADAAGRVASEIGQLPPADEALALLAAAV